MKKILLLVLLTFAAFELTSCGGKSDTPGTADSTKKAEAAQASSTNAPAGAKFKMKAGIAEGTMEMMGQKVQIKMLFDDWGTKMRNETTGDMMGQKMHQVNITKDSMSYIMDMIKKTGQKMKAQPDDMNFANMTPEELKAKGIKEIGKETIGGRECTVYEIDQNANAQKPKAAPGAPPQPDMKGKFWIWNNFPVKMEMGQMMKMEMTKIEETAPPASAFEIPADIKFSGM
ncbi:MAG TPA: hypothetical protein VIX80_04560 [Candidatus Kapabacteria bacterium]